MKKRFSLKRFLREELESERQDLIFLVMAAIPVMVALLVICFHLFYVHPNFRAIMDWIQNGEKPVELHVKQPPDTSASDSPN